MCEKHQKDSKSPLQNAASTWLIKIVVQVSWIHFLMFQIHTSSSRDYRFTAHAYADVVSMAPPSCNMSGGHRCQSYIWSGWLRLLLRAKPANQRLWTFLWRSDSYTPRRILDAKEVYSATSMCKWSQIKKATCYIVLINYRYYHIDIIWDYQSPFFCWCIWSQNMKSETAPFTVMHMRAAFRLSKAWIRDKSLTCHMALIHLPSQASCNSVKHSEAMWITDPSAPFWITPPMKTQHFIFLCTCFNFL